MIRNLPAESVRLYTAAFDSQANLLDDLRAMHRYNAACAATLAAAGQGFEAKPPDAAGSKRLRQLALEWLRRDLAAWTKLTNNPAFHEPIREAMRQWQKDTDLAGIRDKDAVAKLPADEQERCKKLWADAGALLKKIEEKN